MTARPFLAFAVLGLLGAGPALAEPPVKHAISVRERWKAGDVFTRTGEETETVKIKVLADGQSVSDRTQDRQVSYHTVGKVLEADEAGHATKTVLYFVAWSQAGRGAQDGSLSGVLVEVAGRGAARANRILSPDARVSEAAQRWLDDRYGKPAGAVDPGAKDPEDLYEPGRDVAVGETWTPDAAAIGKAFAARLPLVLDKVTTETRLEGVAEGAATVLVSLKLPLRGLQTGESSPLLAWKKGGTVEVSMRMTRTAGSAFEGTLVRESVLEGIADAQGADVDFDMVSRAEIVVRAGGTMPPIPAAPAPAAPGTPSAPGGK